MTTLGRGAAGEVVLCGMRRSVTGNDNDHAPNAGVRAPLQAWSLNIQLQLDGNSLTWLAYPGLFAGGGLDVMTDALLRALPAPPQHGHALDFGCGSGVIAAALVRRMPSLRV